LTDSLVRKETIGQVLGKGFALDVHGAIGAPKESFVKITRAEPGGEDARGRWSPAARGFRPGYENAAMRRYLVAEYIRIRRRG
jgi:nitrate reductase alpha subunit